MSAVHGTDYLVGQASNGSWNVYRAPRSHDSQPLAGPFSAKAEAVEWTRDLYADLPDNHDPSSLHNLRSGELCHLCADEWEFHEPDRRRPTAGCGSTADTRMVL